VTRPRAPAVLGEEPLHLIEHLLGDDRRVLALERLAAQLLHTDVNRVREQAVDVDVVPGAPHAGLSFLWLSTISAASRGG